MTTEPTTHDAAADEQLGRVIHESSRCIKRQHGPHCTFWFDHMRAAAAVIAAGYRKASK